MQFSRLAFVCILGLLCQQANAQFSRHIIYFTNKQGSGFSTSNPQQFLSQRAIDRRTRQFIAYDSTDLPVVPRYLDSIRSKGPVQILSVSKWLNAALIRCSDSTTLRSIRALPFVAVQQASALRSASTVKPKSERNIDFQVPFTAGRGVADVYSYGSSANQVQIHNGQWLHNQGYRGEGVHIAVQDAGFDRYLTTPVLDSMRRTNRILGVRDFVAFDGSVNEDDAHGRECLTVLGALSNGTMVGTAPKASYWLLRTEDASTEQPVEMFNWVVGAEFADSSGADMISSSLGYFSFDDSRFDYTYNDFYKNRALVTRGAAKAVDKGMIVMNSAGNEGQVAWKYLIFPADADSVCAVGAIAANGTIAGFSSFGYPGKVKPNVVSIGLNTTVAGPNGVYTNSGTSFSNPNMAGLVACLWQAFPKSKNMEILDALYRSSDRYTAPTERFGYGVPNMKKAWQLLKAKENQATYGNDWLRATPAVFNDTLKITYVAQNDGTADLFLVHESGRIVRQWSRSIEGQFVYDTTLTGLSDAPSGSYRLTYADGVASKAVTLRKNTAGSVVTDLPFLSPNPGRGQIYLNVPGTISSNVASLDITDASGHSLYRVNGNNILFGSTRFSLPGSAAWVSGVYFVRMTTQDGTVFSLKAVKL